MNLAEQAASEFNHHVAGLFLIAIAVLVLAGMVPRLRFARYTWPVLFIALGLFLAAWSDAEIWPRGTLSWSWLMQHDAEARQHKIYAALLLGIGIVELIRARGHLVGRWRRWAFPMLALCGAALLTMHAHGGTSGISKTPPATLAMAAEVPAADSHMHHHELHGNAESHTSAVSGDVAAVSAHGNHVMDASMIKVQREHLWMTVVGVALAFFKFLADSPSSRRLVQAAWPTAMACLGMLLVFYRE
jgi:hypothetical protein